MGTFDDCWNATGNQCNQYTYSGGVLDTSSARSATPLGAQIVDPGYAAPTISSTTTPNQCKGTGTVQLASILESTADGPAVDDPGRDVDLDVAAVRLPPTDPPVLLGAGPPDIT